MRRLFANGPGEQGSIPGESHTKDSKMVLDTALLNIQHYKVRFKAKVRGKRVAPSPTVGVVAIVKGAFASPSAKVANFTFTLYYLPTPPLGQDMTQG